MMLNFPQDLEMLGGRWFIYGQTDTQIPRDSGALGQEAPAIPSNAIDLDSLGQGSLLLLSLRRGALVPTRPGGSGGGLADTPMGGEAGIQFEIYFRTEPNWIPKTGDLVFDVLWNSPSPVGVGAGVFSKVLNVIRVEWVPARWSDEYTIEYWNLIGREVRFTKSLEKALHDRWSIEPRTRYRRNV